MSEPRKKPQSASARRVAAYRQRMREAGLVPKTIWVRDTKDPAFIAEYRRQAQRIAADTDGEAEIMDWIEKVTADLDLGSIPEYPLPGEK